MDASQISVIQKIPIARTFIVSFDLKMIADHLGCTVMTLIQVYLKSLSGRVNVIGGKQIGEVMQTAHMQKSVKERMLSIHGEVAEWPKAIAC